MLTPRERRFGLRTEAVEPWPDRDVVAAAFYDSLSALFPQGERFFMNSVRGYRDRVTPELAAEIKGFLTQEALHTREHASLNSQVSASGHDMTPLETRTKRELDRVRRRTDLEQLAMTAALDHFTAVLAHELIDCPAHLATAPAETRRLWLWHSGEEIEHKAVAFDTFLSQNAALDRLTPLALSRGHLRRIHLASADVIVPNYVELRAGDRPPAARVLELAGYLIVKPGLLRRMSPELIRFFAPGFHPWQLDDAQVASAALAA